ncbi:unnamed protein product [Aspergillus oryzae RIB40]|uniref:DNA, SC011 n=2 Tax=Aspergillus oryzae TaxID=5062 RepID=Q2U1B0_ASPOR|nr:unnamed protein product [Aspergillus oryzae RIB40]EIT74446.1 hypothetical protein Ao3042_09587 [Aspergillus oryzae 3.042]KDE77931.1 hypothetical protein AO1008_03996 [Aspergillus oryzae 100-8]BAE64655.1 unnamed protein product [Aspergillus oryzae RIB40]|eukprot:EIT74446.1 hypothetical protein Ao3042_09587 [Aspergillus oryzae 3.042]
MNCKATFSRRTRNNMDTPPNILLMPILIRHTSMASMQLSDADIPSCAGKTVVITAPWQLIGLMRALRATLPLDNITINTVAPAATLTGLIPPELAKPIIAMGLPTSSADFVGLAVAYSAVALETRQVELYGKDPDTATVECKGRWNGRTILTLGDRYTELEQAISDLRPQWFGVDNATLTRMQQKATDFR